jgi:ubiquinol-cytochrome c reductase cytochrome b subunit
MVLVVGRGVHIVLLHGVGSREPIGGDRDFDKVPFVHYFVSKDVLGYGIGLGLGFGGVIRIPNVLGDPDNFIEGDPLLTPSLIKPEWYFLFAYAVLRRVPNKLGGVVGLVLRVGGISVLPLVKHQGVQGWTG